MKKLFHVISSPGRGGLEMYVSALIREQASSGYDVAAFALPGTLVHDELRAAGIPLVDAKRHAHFYPPDIAIVRREIRHRGVGLVHSHTRKDVWTASLAAMGTDIAHVHSTYMTASPKRDPHHWLIYRRTDAIVSSSEHTNSELRQFLPVRSEKIHLVRYGRYLDRFVEDKELRTATRAKLGIDDDELALAIIGRVEQIKGVREFAESLLHLSDDARKRVKLFVVGARNDIGCEAFEQSLFEFAGREDVRDRLKILPWQSDSIPILSAIDVLVMGSYCEMYSLSVIEAMAMGRPVIGACAGGTVEQIGSNERGILVEPRSAKAIAEATEQYLSDPAVRSQHGAAAMAWARNQHSFSESLASLANVYAIALERRSPARAKEWRASPMLGI